jgi:cell division inhibitor SepF
MKLVDKVLGFMGFEDDLDEDEKMPEDFLDEVPPQKKKGSVVSLHAQRQTRVVVTDPRSFEEVVSIADNLKNRCSVVINLEQADTELAKRVVDFLSGATYALNGNMQKVGNGIFLFVPSNVDIAGELKDQSREKSIFSWMRS